MLLNITKSSRADYFDIKRDSIALWIEFCNILK